MCTVNVCTDNVCTDNMCTVNVCTVFHEVEYCDIDESSMIANITCYYLNVDISCAGEATQSFQKRIEYYSLSSSKNRPSASLISLLDDGIFK